MSDLKTNLSGKKVLVTGADGFIGSHLCEALISIGADVCAFCIYNSQGSWGWLDMLPTASKKNLDVLLGDIRDAKRVEEAMQKVDTVFHLAALIAIPYSYHAPASFIDTNVTGTYNVLEAALRCGVRRVIHTSTSEVYGTPQTLPIRETHPLNAQSPYAATKVAADQLALSYHHSFGLPVVILRPFNTYGPRQSLRAVLPTMLAQMIAGQSEIRLGRLDTRRDLTFVSDTVDGFVRAAVMPSVQGRVVQLGTGIAVSIAELFELCKRVVKSQACVVQADERLRPDTSEVWVLQSDNSLAKSCLGWQPKVSLEEGVAETAAWLRSQNKLDDVSNFHV